MKISKAILPVIVFSVLVTFAGYAQTGVESKTAFGKGEDSIRCVQNLSMIETYAKQGNYKSAAEFWNQAYDECPASHISIYRYGPGIVGWQIENEQNLTQKAKLFERLMGVYDNYIKFLENSSKSGKAYVLGRKAIDYNRFANPPQDPYKEKAYKWLSEAIELDKSANEAAVFRLYFMLSTNLYKAKQDAFIWTYIDDYLKVVPMLRERATSREPKDTVYAAIKTMADMLFSGAVDCKKLDEVCGKQLDEKQEDPAFLKKILVLYGNAGCEKSMVYFKVAGYAYKIKPSVESASVLAIQAYNNKNYLKAISYFEEAVNLENSNIEKSKLKMKVSATYSELGDYNNAREASLSALAYNPSNSSAYMMIAHLYVQYASTIDSDPAIRKTAYWAAVDKLEKAKEVDPSCVANADKLISEYKAHFPPESSIRNITGNTYTVPGWIQEKTTVRWLNF